MEEMAAMRRDNITAVDPKDPAFNIPDIIEDRRKDSEGRTVITKYARGKMLGKVVYRPSIPAYRWKVFNCNSYNRDNYKYKNCNDIHH